MKRMLALLMLIAAAQAAPADEARWPAVLDEMRTPAQFDEDLERSTGDIVLVHFWASWCIPCRAEMDELADFWRDGYPALAEQGLRVLTVSNDVRDADLERFAKHVTLAFPLYYDPYSRLTGRFGVRGLPSTLVLDRRGRVLDQWLGTQNWSGASFQAQLSRLLDAGANASEASGELDLSVHQERR